jgi:hypothetical protein
MENEVFAGRIRAAAVAAWWVVLLAYILLIVQWGVYLKIAATTPVWFKSVWGEGVSWPQIQAVWLQAMVTFKLMVFAGAAVALWLTLWSRRLRGK